MSDVAVLLLAAGASSRMRGRDKLLEEIDGEPLLRRQAKVACATGKPVTVALPPRALDRQRALHGLPLTILDVSDAAKGMGHTLAAGAAAAPAGVALLVLLADMPDNCLDTLTRLLNAHTAQPNAIVRAATETGTPGHPVVFPTRLRPKLLCLSGDEGARSLVQSETPVLVRTPGAAATTDLDTPEAWAAWRAERKF